MGPSERELAARARRAYELGRLRSTAKILVYLAPAVALALLGGSAGIAWTVGVGAALGMSAVGLLWRGGALGRAVRPGLMAGAIPLLAPLVLRATGHCCMAGACSPLCLPVCTSAGLAAGIVVGLRAVGESEGRRGFTLSASVIAALMGALGCMGMGLGAVGGMAVALALGSAPLAVVGMRLGRG
ncbi:hypothetical protein [Polyangium mundeleinium]|uniref:Uncharacterized protein n=1 Tax=Polyangium mundeleinium TaxID=2995306 RepID=A0ABT5EWZ4_9BACT|nr:hypothetical protein [Polyangium mundeleinium]MDC0745452.1 hypothetical protein [Polyangium mundeleinium]